MSKAELHKLGEYIIQRREKNNNYNVPIRGVSKDGFIDPKQKDADTSLYNVFYKNDFVFNPARMELNSIALNEEIEQGICSSLYEIFYIKDTHILDPVYLNMLLKRDNFIRFCAFKGWGSVREYFRFNEISEYQIPIPTIEEQRLIVHQYKTIQNRIELNKQTITKLEDAAQSIYRKMFIEDIDPENLPEGWKAGEFGDIATINMGQSPSGDSLNKYGNGFLFYQGCSDFGIRFVTPRVYTTAPTKYAEPFDILMSVRAPVGSLNITKEKCCIGRGLASIKSKFGWQSFVLYTLKNQSQAFSIADDDGSVFGCINKDGIKGLPIIQPPAKLAKEFNDLVSPMDDMIVQYETEINMLSSVQSTII